MWSRPSHQIHAVLTDNGMAFADLPKNRTGPSRRRTRIHVLQVELSAGSLSDFVSLGSKVVAENINRLYLWTR